MANLRDIRRRIKSVKNTAQITKAMQMVAAAKMRRAQLLAVNIRPYVARLDELASHLYASLDSGEINHPLLKPRQKSGKICVLIITSDKGLCGALNTNVLREALKQDGPDKVYVSVGRKGRQILARQKKNFLADFSLKDTPTFAESKTISRFLLKKFEEGEFDKVEIFSSRFINTLNQQAIRFPLVPIGAETLAGAKALGAAAQAEKSRSSTRFNFNFEPEAAELLAQLLPHYVHLEVFQKILDSRASEHSARMVAMKSATDNAKELVKDLTLEYNKARQASITRELIEISSAAMAMS